MASVLRQIVAGPRSQHPETGLDLCYVTDNIIVTSGPSQTYPQLAYRNSLSTLVSFLDATHGDNWAIWEFRAEGTGYDDDAVYGRIRHFPWPDHHPPPFRLVPLIVGSMREWLGDARTDGAQTQIESGGKGKDRRVVVVHCKAGKGRSGTATCSYLIAEAGWSREAALTRFTERRMRPQFGQQGVSIPSQLRWIQYVDLWTQRGKTYVDRPVEIISVRAFGLRNGVSVAVEAFEDEGKRIAVLHSFHASERVIVEGGAPGGGGFADMVLDMAGSGSETPTVTESEGDEGETTSTPSRSASTRAKVKAAGLIKTAASLASRRRETPSNTQSPSPSPTPYIETPRLPSPSPPPQNTVSEPGGKTVLFQPTTPIFVPNSDVNIAVERRSRAPSSLGFSVVTAVAHVWFNGYFEALKRRLDEGGTVDKGVEGGVFEIAWEEMDGIKGSLRRGVRALDRLEVEWRFADTGS